MDFLYNPFNKLWGVMFIARPLVSQSNRQSFSSVLCASETSLKPHACNFKWPCRYLGHNVQMYCLPEISIFTSLFFWGGGGSTILELKLYYILTIVIDSFRRFSPKTVSIILVRFMRACVLFYFFFTIFNFLYQCKLIFCNIK